MIQSILIVRLSSIGDIILTTPLVRSVRKAYPQAHIRFAVKKQFADLVRHNPNIDEIVIFDKKIGMKPFLAELQQRKVDWMIDIHGNFRSQFIRWKINPTLTTHYSKQLWRRFWLVTFGWNFYNIPITPVYLRYFEAVANQGIGYDHEGTEVYLPEEAKNATTQLIDKEAGDPNSLKKKVVLCPGASFTNKKWPLENFIATARYLFKERGCDVILLGGPADVDDCKKIQETLEFPVLNVAGKLSLLQSGALLQKADLAITNDSGMMHMAQAQKTKVIAVFGPTVEELGYFPIKENSQVIQTHVKCRPCTHNGLNHCPKKHFRCMNAILPEHMYNAINSLL